MAPNELLTPTSYCRFTRCASRFPDILGVMCRRVSDVEPQSRARSRASSRVRQRNTSVAAEYSIAFRDNLHLLARFEQSEQITYVALQRSFVF